MGVGGRSGGSSLHCVSGLFAERREKRERERERGVVRAILDLRSMRPTLLSSKRRRGLFARKTVVKQWCITTTPSITTI